MKNCLLLWIMLLASLVAVAQMDIINLSYTFRSTSSVPYYTGLLQQTDSGWYLQALYYPEKIPAFLVLYKGREMTMPEGLYLRFHKNRDREAGGYCNNRKKEGLWIIFYKSGKVKESAWYKGGKRWKHHQYQTADQLWIWHGG